MKVKVAQSCPTHCEPTDHKVRGILQARILEWVASPFSRGIFPSPGIEPMSPTLQANSLPAEPPGKPQNPGVGSLSLLQGLFPTQESNQGLQHCRQILYQLNNQGSPGVGVAGIKDSPPNSGRGWVFSTRGPELPVVILLFCFEVCDWSKLFFFSFFL